MPLTDAKAWWKCEEISGALLDATGNGHAFAVTAGGADSTLGVIDNGVSFDGATDYYTCTYHSDFALGTNQAWTVCGWVKPIGTPTEEIIAAKGPYGGTNPSWILYNRSSGGSHALSVVLQAVDGTRKVQDFDISPITPGTWYFVAFGVRDDGSSWLKINCRDRQDFYTLASGHLWTAQYTDNLTLGCGIAEGLGTPGKYFHGCVDEFGYYNRALTDEELGLLCPGLGPYRDVEEGDTRGDYDIRAYTTSENGSDVRLYLPRDWVEEITFEITERGGFGEGNLKILAPWSALPGILGSERIDIWLWNVLVYRGWMNVHERDIDNPEMFAPQLAGLIETLDRTIVNRRYAYSQPQDVARVWGDLVTDYLSGLGIVNESQDIGATLQTFDARDSTLAEAFNRLCDQSPNAAIWGHDTTSDYSDRLYLRPRSTAIAKRISIGGEVQAYAHPYDTGAVRNVALLRGGKREQPNLAQNPSFEERQPASEDAGNLLIEPSFEDTNSGGYWTLSAGTTIQFEGNAGAYGSPRTGSRWLEIDENGEYAEQKVAIVPGGRYTASCWARLEKQSEPNSFVLELEGQDASNTPVTLVSAGFNSATDPPLASELYRRFTVSQDWSAYPTVVKARFRVTAQGGTHTDDGVLVDDCGVFRTDGPAQENWRAHPTGSATMADVDWATRDVTAYHGGTCVKLLADNIGGSTDTLEMYQPKAAWVSVSPEEHYTLLCFWQTDGAGGPSDNALSIGVSQRKSDATAGTSIESATVVGNPATWTMIWLDITTAADTASLQVFIRSRTERALYIDAVMLVPGGLPEDVLAGGYWPGDTYERVWSVENVTTSAPGRTPAVLSADASASITRWGRRATVLENNQIVDDETGQAFAIGWFNAHAVPQVQAQLRMTATRSEDLIFPSGLIRLLNLPSAPDALFPSRIRYTIDGDGVEIDVDLGSQRPELVEMLRVIAGKKISGEIPPI